jgi:hypothetical protein
LGLYCFVVIGIAVINAAIGMFSKKEFTERDRALFGLIWKHIFK